MKSHAHQLSIKNLQLWKKIKQYRGNGYDVKPCLHEQQERFLALLKDEYNDDENVYLFPQFKNNLIRMSTVWYVFQDLELLLFFAKFWF